MVKTTRGGRITLILSTRAAKQHQQPDRSHNRHQAKHYSAHTLQTLPSLPGRHTNIALHVKHQPLIDLPPVCSLVLHTGGKPTPQLVCLHHTPIARPVKPDDKCVWPFDNPTAALYTFASLWLEVLLAVL